MRRLIQLWCVCCLALMVSCKEDEYVYPSVLTEFVEAVTGPEGVLTELRSDDGTRFAVKYRDGLGGLTPDSLYRAVAVYQVSGETAEGTPEASIYSCQVVISWNPLPPKAFKNGIKTDPVDIQSMWRSGNYLNMILKAKVKDRAHSYHFVDEGISRDGEKRVLNLRLYHDRRGDYEAFEQRVYLSVPLSGYRERLTAGDCIRFTLQTYGEGETVREFAY